MEGATYLAWRRCHPLRPGPGLARTAQEGAAQWRALGAPLRGAAALSPSRWQSA